MIRMFSLYSKFKQQTNGFTWFCFKAASAMIIFIATLVLSVVIYMGLFQLVNAMDAKSYYRYASDGKFDKDMYFSEAQEKDTQVFDTLNNMLPEDTTVNRIQEYFKILLKNEKLLKDELTKNIEYVNYLEANDLTVDEVILYMNKIIELDDIILKAALYVAMLIYILIIYFWHKWRIGIFVITGGIYFILVVDSFMSGIFLDACFPFFQKMYGFIMTIQKKADYSYSYEDHILLSKSILPSIREAALTFIILDTVVQSIKNSRKRKRSSNYLALYFAIDDTLSSLGQIKKINPNVVITKLNAVNFKAVQLLYKENKEDNYLREAKEKIDEWKNTASSRRINVSEWCDRLSYLQSVLRKSEYIKNNIIR